jgi:tetratricopeptide (TPR) repeat protein
MIRTLLLLSCLVISTGRVSADARAERAESGPALATREPSWEKSLDEAAAQVREGRMEEAARTLAEGIRAARQRGETGLHIAGTLNDLGTIYHYMDRLQEAGHCYAEAVALLQARGDSPPILADALSHLARLRMLEKRYAEAETLYRKAERVAAPELQEPRALMSGKSSAHAHGPATEPQVGARLATVYYGMAEVLLSMKRPREAREYAERALAMVPASLHHASRGAAFVMLSRVAWQEGAYEEAERLMRDALHAWTTSIGIEHPSYASGLASLAALLSPTRPSEAEKLFEQALRILEAKLVSNHSYRGRVMLMYSEHLQSRGRKREAKDLKRRAEMILTGQATKNQLGFTVDIQTLRSGRGVER